MESFEEPGRISKENLLEVPTLNDSLSEDEDVKATHQHRFSPGPRRRNSDSSEEMEAEAPSTIARKVSFADAFGFDLVSVKEFDTWDVPISAPNDDLEDEDVPVEEFYLTPLFTPPTTQEELLQKVRAQKVSLESVEFLPGITCMKGTIRVLNVSFQKLVYVRMTLDNWLTYYDILGEYVPNSCDGETDQFLFKISLVPPYQRDGAKIEFCIRYETSAGIFWENNDNKNYVLICHKKETTSASTPLENNPLQEEFTDKSIKGCLKITPSSKQEILATDGEDRWKNSRTSETDIPQILYSHVDDNEIKQRKENVGEHVEETEDDNENEKELELLLGVDFNRTSGSTRDERSLYATEPVRFQNEPQELGEKLDSGLLRQPLPISSSSEHLSLDKELCNKQIYSTGNDYSQLSPEECTGIDSAQSSESFSTGETLSSSPYWSATKENEPVHITDVFAGKHGLCHEDAQKDESDNVLRSKTTERLFIGGDDYDDHKRVWEIRPKPKSLEYSEANQLKGKPLEGLDDNIKPSEVQQIQVTSSQVPDSSLEGIIKHEPKKELFERKNQEYLSGELNTLDDMSVTKSSLRSSHSVYETAEEKFKTEYTIDKGKEIKLSILEQFSEEKQDDSSEGHRQYVTPDIDKLSKGEAVVTFSVLDEGKEEEVHESVELVPRNDKGGISKRNKEKERLSCLAGELSQDQKSTESRSLEVIQNTSNLCISCPDFVTPIEEQIATHSASVVQDVFDSREILEKGKYNQSHDPANRNILETKPSQSEPDRVITGDQRNQISCGDQSSSDLESQLAEREREANKRVQMKHQTGGEAMWGIRDNTQCLNVTSTDELFTCQDPVRHEETSVAEHDSTGEAEAVTTAYVIKMTSESTPEKMSAGKKAVIVKLPQETALSDSPTEERETVFDTHEERNDGSHYPFCQCNTVGVLCDTKFEKEPVSDICNARVHETGHGEMISACCTNEKLTRAEHNTENDTLSGKILWTSSTEGKAICDQELYVDTSLRASHHPPQGLHNEEAEEGSIRRTFPYVGAKMEEKNSPADVSVVGSCYEGSSVTSSEGSLETHPAEGAKVLDPYTEAANISLEWKLEEFPSDENGEKSTDQFSHQPQIKQQNLLGPTILISEPIEEREEISSECEGLLSEAKQNTESQAIILDHEEISGQQNEASSLPSECLILKHIGYKILYFLFFVVFCVTLYHYDLIVCFALYLFSLYWLYCEGGKNKETVKKE
ncbi:protein phosphatase 1 regulatory subunit 3A [Sceloporus undulatus]|uniref:protein phosphatase 1 regulatory subunit 3A n=1 Tax=Sceloporus undulatus TaxID=8520 RepID=UPI001C4B28CB|nr:protein phosphatase 1 regulatory subunit 3A [Sceloporus undulatus]